MVEATRALVELKAEICVATRGKRIGKRDGE